MIKKSWFYTIITYLFLTVALFLLFDYIWPDSALLSKVVPFVASALITHFIRKIFDFIYEFFNRNTEQPIFGILISVDYTSRRFLGYGASCGEIIHAGNFKANYEVELGLIITIQNESPNTVYELNVTYTPNNYFNNVKLIDTRQNKLQPLEGNKHIEFKLRIMKNYYDVFASDVDKEVQKLSKIIKEGKEVSLLQGSKLEISYKDIKHKKHTKTEILK